MYSNLPFMLLRLTGIKTTFITCTVLLSVLVGMPHAKAQGNSVEELERRQQKANEDRARRDAAEARDRKSAEAERKCKEAEANRAAAERSAQEARQANLVVQADAPCTLFVNGRDTARLPKGFTEVKLSPGQKLVSCLSTEEAATFEGELEARSGQDTLLRIALAAKVAEIRITRATALEREAQARLEIEARTRADAEFRVACERGFRRSVMGATSDSSVLQQCGTGLQWTRSDNGRDVNWSQAQSYCRGLGEGWNLPTVEQLQSLYDRALPSMRCGTFTCEVSSQFRLSIAWFWSSESAGFSESWAVDLIDGRRHSYSVANPTGNRALCVRRAEYGSL